MPSFGTTVSLVTVTVTGQDAYGKDILSKVETPIPGCSVWPATTGSEVTQGQDIVTDLLVCLFPPGTVIGATDKVKTLGRTYEVTGNSFDWASPLSGSRIGVQVNLKAVSG